MNNKINDGGAAFPRPSMRQQTVEGIYCDSGQQGMTLRDWYIGKAVEGFLSNSGGFMQANGFSGFGWVNITEKEAAEACVSFADAVMKAKEQP